MIVSGTNSVQESLYGLETEKRLYFSMTAAALFASIVVRRCLLWKKRVERKIKEPMLRKNVLPCIQ